MNFKKPWNLNTVCYSAWKSRQMLESRMGGASSNAPLKLRCLHYSWISDYEVHLKLWKVAGAIFKFRFCSRAILFLNDLNQIWQLEPFLDGSRCRLHLCFSFERCNMWVTCHTTVLQKYHPLYNLSRFFQCIFCLLWFTSHTACLFVCDFVSIVSCKKFYRFN